MKMTKPPFSLLLLLHPISAARTKSEDRRIIACDSDDDDERDLGPTTAYVQPEPVETVVPENNWDLGQ